MQIQHIATDDNHISGVIQPTAHFNFRQSLRFLDESGANDRLDTFDPDAETLSRPLLLNDAPYRVTLQAEAEGALQVTVQAPDEQPAPDETILREAVAWADRRFWLSVDMNAVRDAIAVDDFGKELVERYFPLRPANYASAWDAILISVVHAQIYPGLATQLDNTLAEQYGMNATFDGETVHLTPRPFDLLKVFPDELRGMKFSRQKADYLTSIPQTVMNNPDTYNFLHMREMDGRAAVKQLKELRGVGKWTSQNVAMRGLPHTDVFIDEDNLRKTLAPYYFRSVDAIDKSGYLGITERFAPYRSFACFYAYAKYFDVDDGS